MRYINNLKNLPKEKLIGIIEDAAKNWLAHDGLWFLAIEQKHGMEEAMDADAKAWNKFSKIEARRIMARHNIEPGGGLKALEEALKYRLYAFLNDQEATWVSESKLIFKMKECRVQHARKRDKRPPFPCKEVGIVEYTSFAEAIDPRIKVRCLGCPPDDVPEDDYWCAWEFTFEE